TDLAGQPAHELLRLSHPRPEDERWTFAANGNSANTQWLHFLAHIYSTSSRAAKTARDLASRRNITQISQCDQLPTVRFLAPLGMTAFLFTGRDGCASQDPKCETAHTARESTTRAVRAFAEGTEGAN